MISLNKKTVLLAVGIVAAWPAVSHHSTAMYDKAHPIVLDGTVTIMEWRNPHVTIDVMSTPTPDHPARIWTVEVASPGVMTRSGWSKRSLNPGDRVQVQLAPLRDGRPGGLVLQKITIVNTGKILSWKNLETELAGSQ
jgi:Family of unknown function (DUF6152)